MLRESRTIVHLEDNPWIAREVGDACSRAGMRYVWFSEPPENLAATISARRPDAILSDLNMPRMDGIKVVRVLRSDPQTLHIPIVVYTTVRSENIQKEALAAGANAVFTKYSASPEEVIRSCASLMKPQNDAFVPAARTDG